uniref:KIB1-4 beta-propeller domain-containing protein n=1 Tax=Setaria viridis TaxID=4556 RepID=A0A4U6V564_SETVI|nr:hypothetical protein SEVIR_5G465300v2 [Setaria viridis]
MLSLGSKKRVCRRPRGRSSSTTAGRPDWRLLPDNVIVLIGDRFLADNDLDYYIDFRAACDTWRRATDDPKRHGGADPRFQPKAWAVQKHFGSPHLNRVVSMVNLKTCRLVTREIPLLGNYRYINATDAGLLVLWDGGMPPWQPCRALVLNPLTGSMAFFSVPIFAEGIRAVAVNTSPLMLFASNLFDFLGWADLDSQDFEEHRVRYPDLLANMKLFAGDIYVVNWSGSIFSTASDAIVADEGAQPQQRSAEMIRMNPTTIHAASWLREGHPHYYLVESAGELLLVTRSTAGGQAALVHKVDTVNKVLEPMVSIGSRAIFINKVRSFSVDANMFPAVEGGCIYFVETLANLFHHGIIASSVRLADQRQEDIMQFGFQGQFGPPTLVEVLADHCRYTPEHELEHYYGWNWDDDEI